MLSAMVLDSPLDTRGKVVEDQVPEGMRRPERTANTSSASEHLGRLIDTISFAIADLAHECRARRDLRSRKIALGVYGAESRFDRSTGTSAAGTGLP